MKLGDRVNYKAHADDEGVDRIEIVAVPRFKTSGLSGDEWRMSATIIAYRKGVVVGEKTFSKMETAIAYLPGLWQERYDWCKGPLWGPKATECHQFSCATPATHEVRLKEQFSNQGDGPLPDVGSFDTRRAFCDEHRERGDCGREDLDANYEVVSAVEIDQC